MTDIPISDYTWWHQLPAYAEFRHPGGARLRSSYEFATADSVSPSPDHAWLEDPETGTGGWYLLSEIRKWERL